ncbi:gluconokinase [Candidatus Enterococcus willemsii]|uniref:Gluconokinase n=1 Tax=Candidatus Enterococcus willemsii TaxID=1857215 RepID=A0ABQ6Z2R3_9ENTE|nr:FGGY family carbohydrate kinase [Enterococcus sp. CU12B]KAF1305759.1 gluconokinase [Enterococcus sp. CU12B]
MFLGIDIGTTAIKFAVIENGLIKYQQTSPVTTYRESNGSCYQRFHELLAVLKVGIQSIPKDMRQQLEKMSFSVAMHSVCPWQVGADKIFIWSDTQAESCMEQFKQEAQARVFYERTGTPLHAMSPFAKILYFHQQKMYRPTTMFYGLKELVMHHFVGQFVLDYATASATGLFHLTERTWDEEILQYVGITTDQLALTVDTTEEFALLPEVAHELMIPTDIQVVIGASDGCLAAFASYCATGIPNSLTIGTSASVRRVTKIPHFDPTKQNFCYYLNSEYYVTGAPSNNGGCVLEWASQIYADTPAEFFERLPETLAASVIGANGLRFAPYINGERAPLWQKEVSGALTNIKITHTKADMVRSIVEGILMNIRTLTRMVGVDEALSLSGGFFKSEVLRQLTADILGTDCYLSDYNEPIMGLYYLIYGPSERPTQTIEKVHYDETVTDVYHQLFQ